MYHVAFKPRSNRATFIHIGEVTDQDDLPVDLTGLSLVFQIADKFGCPRLLASSDNGKITVIGLGLFRVVFTLDEMRSLCAGTYQTGLTLANDDQTETVQFFIGPLPILDGIVP